MKQEHVRMVRGGDDMYEQCAWCTLVKSGPYAGMLLVEEWEDGSVEPVLVNGYSHGICSVCDAVLRGAHCLKKAQKTVTPVETDVILRLEQTG